MARIPLQVASRPLDTGSVVQYPGGGEIGRALQGAGDELQSVRAHVDAQKKQQEAFDAKIKESEFQVDLSTDEDQAAQNAPADGSGIHDQVYGQIDPVTQQAVKPGSFDKRFDETLAKMPESQRADFAAKRELYRKQGSERMATVQYNAQQKYYDVEIAKQQNQTLTSIASTDPSDTKTITALKQQGIDFIEASPKPALYKDAAKADWLAKSEEAAYQGRLAKDPSYAAKGRADLGLAPVGQAGDPVDIVTNKIIGVESGGDPNAENPNSSASGVGQFLDSTWVQTIRQHRPDVAAGKSAAQIIAMKKDRALGKEMTRAYQQDNADYLANRGEATTPDNIYLAHFLGPGGAVNALKADPNTPIVNIVGQDVVNANPFLRGKTAGDTIAWAGKKMGGASSANPAPNPEYANIPLDRRLTLANQADVQARQQEAADLAMQKADYTAYKDHFALDIVSGQIADPALITGDKTLNNGDKASLLRSFNEQNKGAIQIQTDLTALNSNSLSLDPYSSDDKKRADNLYSAAAGKVPLEQQAGLATSIIQQTHVVPQPIINDMRRGLSSTNPAQVVAAAQTAQKISAFDPAALGRRDGGSEVQKAADDFSYYVNKLNLPPEEAARRMIDNASPEKQRDRKALKPAADEFVKSMGDVDLSTEFKEGGFFSGAPALGLDPAQEAGIKADFLALAEDQFYSANGDANLAKNRALEQMKAIYGVSSLSGAATVVKYPPERYWPKQNSSGFLGGADQFSYVRTQLFQDIGKLDESFEPGAMRLVATPETEADVKAGRLPGYSVLWEDANGNLQAIPGKVWRPDVTHMLATQEANRAKAQADANEAARRKDIETISGQDREFSMDNMESGNTQVYTPEKRAKFLEEQRKTQPEPGANIPNDLPDGVDQNAFGNPL
jgi:hypothetical protein